MRAAIVAALALASCDYARLEPAEDAADLDAPAIDAPEPIDALDAADALDAIDAPDAPSCLGEIRCDGDTAQQCNAANEWIDLPACTNFCGAGGCVNPPSCSSIGNCAGVSCCAARLVPGGTYHRSYDGVTYLDMTFPATVSPFVLDRFETTVNRFRRFVAAYPGSLPAAGTGRNPHVAADAGWSDTWVASMPATKAALETALTACSASTFTIGPGANEDKPVNCVSWYLAYAFCIWDGGRLPSEAEWNRAAAGGDLQRVYPWSAPASSTTIDATRAVYGTTEPSPVGTRPQGHAFWAHADLAGNVQEWIADWYRSPYATSSCVDCQDTTSSSARVLRGGQYTSGATSLYAAARTSTLPTTAASGIGFRCVHDP